jgi:hypothetical protein
MSLREVYQLYAQIREHMGCLGHWQALTLALYSVGVVLAEKCIPSKVSEKCAVFGKPETVQRRLERWLDNERIRWWVCCREWARWVLSRYVGEQLIVLVDETKLGAHLSVMVVALAYRGSAIPLAYWCDPAKLWPEGGQVGLISQLLSWVLEGLPEGCVPLVQADRAIGCSPKLVRSLLALRWHFLLRIQRQSKVRLNGPGAHLATPGQCPASALQRPGPGLQESRLAVGQPSCHLGSGLQRSLVPHRQCPRQPDPSGLAVCLSLLARSRLP